MDLIEANGNISLNIACLGMDADVAYKMVKYKHWPLISGPMAYNLAIVDVFFHRLGNKLSVTMDTTHGTVKRDGRYLIALAASGQYYGGGFHGAPMARPDDGLIDFILIKAIPRLKILQFISKFKKGEYMEYDFCEHFRGTSMHIQSERDVIIALDGECSKHRDIRFALCDHTVRFVMPASGAVKQKVFSSSPTKRGKQKQLSGAFVKKM